MVYTQLFLVRELLLFSDLYDEKNKLARGEISLKEYETILNEYEHSFSVISEVKNVYNRLVSWKAGSIHSSISTKKQGVGLVQNFYISIR